MARTMAATCALTKAIRVANTSSGTSSIVSATAPGWSNREPVFYPEWVEKVDTAVAG